MNRLATLLILLSAAPAWAEPGVVNVTIASVRSNAGHILVAVCERAAFLKPNCHFTGSKPAVVGSVTIRIAGVPPGVYAAQAFQDENDNGEIDRNFVGIPREGLGFSNDAKMRFGPPSFDEAAFTLGPNGGSIGFSLRYFE